MEHSYSEFNFEAEMTLFPWKRYPDAEPFFARVQTLSELRQALNPVIFSTDIEYSRRSKLNASFYRRNLANRIGPDMIEKENRIKFQKMSVGDENSLIEWYKSMP